MFFFNRVDYAEHRESKIFFQEIGKEKRAKRKEHTSLGVELKKNVMHIKSKKN
jgi:hypothetical protein